ncbi:MAG TPA: hypothetical protein ACFYEL_01815 [Candidatus Wunengus californicus]|uniref:hypothetical protein n=1 Tax=Candidatus Wunengus californicus TaxID=3367619 RepID=UPI004029143C
MIKEAGIVAEIHKIREWFYQKTKNMSHVELLNLIRTQSKNVEEELFQILPNPELVVRRRHKVPEPEAMKEIHQIREHGGKYGNK